MEWYYAVSDKQMGPVSEEEFKRLTGDGTIRPDTLVWRAGQDGWKPYREVSAEMSAAAQPGPTMASTPDSEAPAEALKPSGGTVVCRECGKLFRIEDVVVIEGAFICGDCKPIYLQRIREGVGGRMGHGNVSQEELLAGDYEVNTGDAISNAWALFQKNAGMLIGASLLVYLALFAANAIPYLSMITGLLLSGPLMAGLWHFFIRSHRNEQLTIGDAFSGFGPQFWQLVLVNIVTSILSMVCMAPFFLAMMAIFGAAFVLGNTNSAPPDTMLAGGAVAVLIGSLLISLAATTALTTAWLFAVPLVVDKKLAFWPAMELSRKMVFKHFWGVLLLVIACGLLFAVGFLLCGVGVLLTAPVAFGAFAWQYERIFGNLQEEN